jgi:hypothetical protein
MNLDTILLAVLLIMIAVMLFYLIKLFRSDPNLWLYRSHRHIDFPEKFDPENDKSIPEDPEKEN